MTDGRERDKQVDVLIVAAVKDEWDAVLAVDTRARPGSSWAPRAGAAGPEVFYRDFTAECGDLRMAVVQPFGMGGEHAVIAAAALLEQHPGIRCLAMCGVCAGRRGDVALGDVIIADRTWPYDAGKLKATVDEQGRRTERFQGDMDLYRIHPPEWRQRAERFQIESTASWVRERPRSYEEQGDWVLERLVRSEDPRAHANRKGKCPDWRAVLEQLWKAKRLEQGELKLTEVGRKHIDRRLVLEPDGLVEPGPFKTVVGPIASGAPVVEDPMIFERLSDQQAMRKVIGIEMEIAGILALAYLRKLPFAVVMKGVMDHADAFKSDNMKRFAARASAECLIAFLRQNVSGTTEHDLQRPNPSPDDRAVPQPGSRTKKHTILFLAANPGSDRLALDREARAIRVELERSGFRDRFEFETRWAVEPLDLLRELRKLKPTVVHFSGHRVPGGEQQHGLYFQGSDCRPRFVSAEAIEQTFGAAGGSVKLVVLSACYSEVQAQALVAHVDCVVGMGAEIHDDAARSFAIGFYGGLGEREPVAAACAQGRAAMSLEGLPDGGRPQLKVRAGVDASRLVLGAEAR